MSAGGEPVTLAPGIATPLGLIIHELAVNAAKYGCFQSRKATWRWAGPCRRTVGNAF